MNFSLDLDVRRRACDLAVQPDRAHIQETASLW